MRVSEVAKELSVTADTVRFYTRIGYLKPSKNIENGYKAYRADDLRLMRFILSARKLGFSVEDIGQILATAVQDRPPCPIARQLIKQRLQENEKSFFDSARLRQRMLAAIDQWDKKPDQAPSGNQICHLIEDFTEG